MSALQIDTGAAGRAARRFGQHHAGAVEIRKTMDACVSLSGLADASRGSVVAEALASLAAAIGTVLAVASRSTTDADLADSIGPLAELVAGWQPPPGLSTASIAVKNDESIPDLPPGAHHLDAAADRRSRADAVVSASERDASTPRSEIVDDGDRTDAAHGDGRAKVAGDDARSASYRSGAPSGSPSDSPSNSQAGSESVRGAEPATAEPGDRFDLVASTFHRDSTAVAGWFKLAGALAQIANAIAAGQLVTTEIGGDKLPDDSQELVVVGFVERDGQPMLQLFNPSGNNDGVFGDYLRSEFAAILEPPGSGYVLVPEANVDDLLSRIRISE